MRSNSACGALNSAAWRMRCKHARDAISLNFFSGKVRRQSTFIELVTMKALYRAQTAALESQKAWAKKTRTSALIIRIDVDNATCMIYIYVVID